MPVPEEALSPMGDQAPSLYGFRIASADPLRFGRRGGGQEPLELVTATDHGDRPEAAPISEWQLHGGPEPARAWLYRNPHGFEYWTSDAGRFRIDLARGRIELPASPDAIVREQRLCGLPMILSYRHRGDFSLHAAAVEVNGRALILAAPAGFGKSTLALEFHRQGHRLLSEDLVCCRPGRAEVLPGPALVRMRPDVFTGDCPPGTHVVLARPDRVYLGVDEDRRGSGAAVPVAGIVFLRSGTELRLEPTPGPQSVADLWHLHYHLPTREDRSSAFRELCALAGAVRTWNLWRPLRLDHLGATAALLADSCAPR